MSLEQGPALLDRNHQARLRGVQTFSDSSPALALRLVPVTHGVGDLDVPFDPVGLRQLALTDLLRLLCDTRVKYKLDQRSKGKVTHSVKAAIVLTQSCRNDSYPWGSAAEHSSQLTVLAATVPSRLGKRTEERMGALMRRSTQLRKYYRLSGQQFIAVKDEEAFNDQTNLLGVDTFGAEETRRWLAKKETVCIYSVAVVDCFAAG
ncbi:hypothetical protein BJ170DRAFT_592696 [Xylariales sp. AK1849]|nr:hypothetical protein BJ170DRAFT_592696 [Xylariales sp. AK1849]